MLYIYIFIYIKKVQVEKKGIQIFKKRKEKSIL